MLKKLMKYDLIWINKFMLIFFSISLIICTLTRIMSNFTTSFIGNTIYLILRGCAISCFISTIINCAIRIWAKFRISLYKDESYLTHTLPVSKNTLYNSKVLSSITSVVISLFATIICLCIAFLNKDVINYIKELFSDKETSFIVISLFITVILEMIYMIFSGLIGILLGHKSNNHRILKSVLIGIGLYYILQIILLGIIYSIGLLNTNINDLFISTDNIKNISESLKSLVIIANIIYTLFIISMYYIGKKIFNKGINVE